MITASYLQSVTENLALGVEGTAQFGRSGRIESQLQFVGRLKGANYVATAAVAQAGTLQATYFHQVNNTVHVGAEVEALVTHQQRESICTVGAKFDFRGATLRAQVDTMGRVGMLLEEKLSPGFSFLISGELDHYNDKSKFGFGVVIGQ